MVQKGTVLLVIALIGAACLAAPVGAVVSQATTATVSKNLDEVLGDMGEEDAVEPFDLKDFNDDIDFAELTSKYGDKKKEDVDDILAAHKEGKSKKGNVRASRKHHNEDAAGTANKESDDGFESSNNIAEYLAKMSVKDNEDGDGTEVINDKLDVTDD